MSEDTVFANRVDRSMQSSPATVPIAFVQGIVSGARAKGRPVEPLLATAGIAPALLEQTESRVTAQQYVALFRAVREQLDDDALGFLSRALRRGSFALIAGSALDATSLEGATRRSARTFGLLQDDVALELSRDGAFAGITLRFLDPDCAHHAFLHELLLRVFWRLLAWLAGGQLPVEHFDFAFDQPPSAQAYGKAFPAPRRYARGASGFWFDASHLKSAVRRDKAALKTFLNDAEAHIILPRRTDSVGERVRGVLQQAAPAWPDLAATANVLNMAASTLQRQLALEGSSFQGLKDELRRDMAIVLLHTSAETFGALAARLGFSDSAAFQRAFKGWTGSAPGVYRRGLG